MITFSDPIVFKLVNIRQSLVIAVSIDSLFHCHPFFHLQFHVLMTHPLETPVPDACQQVVFFRVRQ